MMLEKYTQGLAVRGREGMLRGGGEMRGPVKGRTRLGIMKKEM